MLISKSYIRFASQNNNNTKKDHTAPTLSNALKSTAKMNCDIKKLQCYLAKSTKISFDVQILAAYLELSQTFTTKLFAKILKGFQPLTIFAKKLHHRCYVALGSKYVSATQRLFAIFFESWLFCKKNSLMEFLGILQKDFLLNIAEQLFGI